MEQGSQPVTHFLLNITEVHEVSTIQRQISLSDEAVVESVSAVSDGQLEVVLVIRGLEKSQYYSFRVAAVSSVGVGGFSDPSDPAVLGQHQS